MNAVVYMGDFQLGGIPEWKGWGGPISQEAVDKRWAEIGGQPPAPLVPKALIGLYVISSRGARMFSTKPKGKVVNLSKADGRAMADFMNYWGKVAIDPYHKQSGISKVAGGLLKVAGAALPAFNYFEAAAAAGNMALASGKKSSDKSLDARVMAPAFAADAVAAQLKEDAVFKAQMSALQSAIPGGAAVALDTAPAVPVAAPKKSSPLPILGALLLLGAMLA